MLKGGPLPFYQHLSHIYWKWHIKFHMPYTLQYKNKFLNCQEFIQIHEIKIARQFGLPLPHSCCAQP